MQNRFAFKDFVIVLLLTGVIIAIWQKIVQDDRVWTKVQEIQSSVDTLSTVQAQLRRDMNDMRAVLEAGITVQQSSNGEHTPPASPLGDPVEHREAMRASQDFAEGGTLVDAFGTKVASVTALTYKDLYGRRVQDFVLESLATRDDRTLEYKPLLARSWTVDDRSEAYEQYRSAKLKALDDALAANDGALRREVIEDAKEALSREDAGQPEPGTPQEVAFIEATLEAWKDKQIREDPDRPSAIVITFKLRRDVNFSDGQPMTAADVVYSWELVNNLKLDAPQTRNFLDNVEKYIALDDYTVEFHCREPNYQAFGMVSGFGVLPKHFYEKFDVLTEINRKPGLLMGTGPFRMRHPENWTPGQLLEVVRNKNYWGVPAGVDRLVWLEIENDVARLTEFTNGNIDYFSATPEQYERLKEDPKIMARANAFEINAIPSGYSFIGWNQIRNGQPTVFADRRVRQAMTLLIDRERIAKEIYKGYARVASGPFDGGGPQAAPSVVPLPYDPQRALALLKESGWVRGPDGVLTQPDGRKLRFALTYPSGNDIYDRTMLMIKDSMRRHGVIMDQDPQEWSVFVERLDGRAFDACALAWGGGSIEGDIRQMFHTSQIAGGANNFIHYSNPELDRLIDQARRTIDENARMPLWHACHRVLHEDQPYTFMFRRKSLLFIDKRFKNIQLITTGINGRDEWYVPAELQLR